MTMAAAYGAVDSTSAPGAEPSGDEATRPQRAAPTAALVVVGGLAMLAGIGAAMRRDPRERRAASMTAARASSAAAHGGDAPYARTHALSGEAFFDAFTFFNSSDPSHGTVECVSDASLSRRAPRRARAPLTARSARSFSLSDRYVDRPTALEYGLISTNATTGEVRFGADSSEDRGWVTVWRDGADYGYWPGGRKSVRLESRASFEGGLFVLSLAHVPTGCGTWLGYWLKGGDPWPNHGEVDILENIDENTDTQTVLHTNNECSMKSQNASATMTGTWHGGPHGAAMNCSNSARKQWRGEGCGVHGGNNTMGAPFNAMGGGVYALEWDASSDGHFAAWYWPHGGEPDELRSRASESDGSAAAAATRALDVDAAAVDTAEWGKPYAYFQLGDATCPTTHFANMSISFTLTFCGDWSTYDKAWGCADNVAQNGWPETCAEFVRTYPQEFTEAYWAIKYLDIYERGGAK